MGGLLSWTAGILALPCTHIHRRGQTVLFRRIIPHDLRLHFGQREILRALGHATTGETNRMSQRLWYGTKTLFTLVRFNRSRTRADISQLAEQYLEFESFAHDRVIANIGHYPELEDLPDFSASSSGRNLGINGDRDETISTASFNDPAEAASLHELHLKDLKIKRACNDFASVRSEAQKLAPRNSHCAKRSTLMRARTRMLFVAPCSTPRSRSSR